MSQATQVVFGNELVDMDDVRDICQFQAAGIDSVGITIRYHDNTLNNIRGQKALDDYLRYISPPARIAREHRQDGK